MQGFLGLCSDTCFAVDGDATAEPDHLELEGLTLPLSLSQVLLLLGKTQTWFLHVV